MNKQYDFIYLTNTPSFYKARLCEELAKKHSVLLVLYGYGAEAVNTRLSGNENGFDYFFLHEGDAGKRNKALVLFRLLKLMARVRARRVLFSGWMAPEYNIYSFLSSKRRNAVICESSAIDSGMDGWKGLLKKAVIRRMSAALPSGSPTAPCLSISATRATSTSRAASASLTWKAAAPVPIPRPPP